MVSVVFVGGDEAFLELCCRRLESVSDFSVSYVVGCESGLSFLEGTSVDVVVSVHPMSCDGDLDFLERVKSRWSVPVLLMVADRSSDLVESALGKGADDFVPRDLDEAGFRVLRNRVRNLAGSSDKGKDLDWLGGGDGLLEQVIGLAPVSIKVKDGDGTIVLANDAFAGVMETSVEDLIGETFENSSLTDEQVEVIEETDRRVLENGERVDIDEQFLTDAEGEEVILRTTKIPFKPEGGGERYVLTVASNITEQRRRESSLEDILEASREMASAQTVEEVARVAVNALDASQSMDVSGVALYDEDNRVFRTVAMTQNTELFSEKPVFDEAGSLAGEVFRDQKPRFYEDLSTEDVWNPDTELSSEVIMPLGKHGVLISGSLEKSGFDSTDVYLMKLFGSRVKSALDRAEREKKLRVREDQLEKQNQRLNKFASIISHDLRNPLNIAKGYLDMAYNGEDPDLEEVDSALKRMEGIVESLLTLARHTEDFEEEEVDMERLAREAWSFSRVDGAELVVKECFVVEADRDKLMHVLENLFSNASIHGGENVTVTVGKLDNGFFVENDGEPIPEDIRDNIFDFGYTNSEEGSGLGLSIVKSIVDFHDWNISLNHTDKGPRFEFQTD